MRMKILFIVVSLVVLGSVVGCAGNGSYGGIDTVVREYFQEHSSEFVGPQGEKGDIGPVGLTGPQGEQGSQGLTGLKGDKGNKGAIGSVGLTGDEGKSGSSSVINVWVRRLQESGSFRNPPLTDGIPTIWKGDEVTIYGAGFIVGEDITFYVNDGGHSWINIGSTSVRNSAGVFAKWFYVDWSNTIPHVDETKGFGRAFGSIKAVGSEGSESYCLVFIGRG